MFDYSQIPSPCYVIDELLLRRNLELIRSVKERSGADIILAFKAFALWRTFNIVREYIPYSTASSLSEARLAYEEMGSKAHTYAPIYKEDEFDFFAIKDYGSYFFFCHHIFLFFAKIKAKQLGQKMHLTEGLHSICYFCFNLILVDVIWKYKSLLEFSICKFTTQISAFAFLFLIFLLHCYNK